MITVLMAVALWCIGGALMTVHFALGVLPFLAGCWCISKASPAGINEFVGLLGMLALVGFLIAAVL